MTGSTLLFVIPLLVVVVLLALGVAALGRERSSADDDAPPTNGPLLSPAELSFYHVLCGVAAERFVVFIKVAPAALVGADDAGEQPPFDFLLCHPETTAPLLAVALDRRPTADEHPLARACEAASLPLLRVGAAKRYDAGALRARIDAALDAPQS